MLRFRFLSSIQWSIRKESHRQAYTQKGDLAEIVGLGVITLSMKVKTRETEDAPKKIYRIRSGMKRETQRCG